MCLQKGSSEKLEGEMFFRSLAGCFPTHMISQQFQQAFRVPCCIRQLFPMAEFSCLLATSDIHLNKISQFPMLLKQKLQQEIQPFAKFPPDFFEINCCKGWILINETITSPPLMLVYSKHTPRELLLGSNKHVKWAKDL